MNLKKKIIILKKNLLRKFKINLIKNNIKLLNIFKKLPIFFLFIYFLIFIKLKKIKKIKICLCTVGRLENLYIQEFIEYYIKLGIDHIFIYDDNDVNTEKISNSINPIYKNQVTVYENLTGETKHQSGVYNNCYKNNYKIFDWLLMVDMDEFLYIKRYTLKKYLTKSIFNKCDFIKFNWVLPTDNNLIHYDNRSLFERFKGPYIKSIYVKSIIRGNISNLKFMVHSPYESPEKNITCNSSGKKLQYDYLNFEFMPPTSIKNAYIIHFKYKSTEEYIKKYKRGYHLWKGTKLLEVLNTKIMEYLNDNKITLEKLQYFERELNISLNKYKKNLHL